MSRNLTPSPQGGQFHWVRNTADQEFLVFVISARHDSAKWSALYWEPNGRGGFEQLALIDDQQATLLDSFSLLTTYQPFDEIERVLKEHQSR